MEYQELKLKYFILLLVSLSFVFFIGKFYYEFRKLKEFVSIIYTHEYYYHKQFDLIHTRTDSMFIFLSQEFSKERHQKDIIIVTLDKRLKDLEKNRMTNRNKVFFDGDKRWHKCQFNHSMDNNIEHIIDTGLGKIRGGL